MKSAQGRCLQVAMLLAGKLLSVIPDKFTRNWSLLVLSSVGGQALGMLATIRVARVLSPEGYGLYNLVQTVAGLGAVVAGLGLRNVIIRQCARQPEWSGLILSASALMRAGMLIMAGAGVMLYSLVSPDHLVSTYGGVTVGLLVALMAWDLVESVFFGLERMEFSAGINLVGAAVWAGVTWGFPSSWLVTLNVTIGFALVQFLKSAAYLVVTYSSGCIRLHGQPMRQGGQAAWLRSQGLGLLRQSVPFYWLALLAAATNQVPILLLMERSGGAEVGLYNAGYRLIYPMQMLLLTALTALYPGLSRTSGNDDEQFVVTVRRALLGIALLGSVGATTVGLLRSELALFFFGSAYLPAADSVAFQCWYTVLFAVYSLVGTVLAARDRQRWLAWLSTCYAVSTVPIVWLGAGGGASGLAASMLLAAVVGLSYHWYVLQKAMPYPFAMGDVLLPTSFLAVGAAAGWLTPQSLPLSARVPLAFGLLTLACMMALRQGVLRGISVRLGGGPV
ncbi:MAG: oligosaccharide flippase family protein [Chloroflexi bacterium]|nr:oligosaccharide flippase family protein [Chloroflexota bacterium]